MVDLGPNVATTVQTISTMSPWKLLDDLRTFSVQIFILQSEMYLFNTQDIWSPKLINEMIAPMNLLDFNRIKQITTATQRQESEFFEKIAIITFKYY